MESKYKPGTKVRIIGWGHAMWITKEAYHTEHALAQEANDIVMYGSDCPRRKVVTIKPQNLIQEDELNYVYDAAPEVVGQEGIIKGSYNHLYGGDKEGDYKQYSLIGIKGKLAWYSENQLEEIIDDEK